MYVTADFITQPLLETSIHFVFMFFSFLLLLLVHTPTTGLECGAKRFYFVTGAHVSYAHRQHSKKKQGLHVDVHMGSMWTLADQDSVGILTCILKR